MKQKIRLLNIVTFISVFILFSHFIHANLPGNDSDNVTVKVNITEAYPVIYSTVINDGISSIDLIPGGQTIVNCTAKMYDWNGWDTIDSVTAVFWNSKYVNMSDPQSNSTLYYSSNCTNVSNAPPYNVTYLCRFDVWFYALNGTDTWYCNVTAKDDYGFTNHNFSHPNSPNSVNTTTINTLYAMDVTPIIDFGQAVTNEYIENKTCNVTNWGNMELNISVQGYDADNAMDCDIREIPYISASGDPTLKYSSNSSSNFSTSIFLNNTMRNISDFKIDVINDSTYNTPDAWHSTFWHLWIPIIENPFGECNGTVTFTAWAG